ncbi:hypothetical protein LDENG_00299500 [Lucifuga dentata]|nr:hypothetical protein LDENG_00299500 [Lucifuga dentata]
MALLFDLVQNSASILCQSNPDIQKSGGLGMEKPLETAALLSLSGVGSVVLNQWHSSAQRNTHSMAAIMDNLLRVGLTSGQTVHVQRKEDSHSSQSQKVPRLHDQVLHSGSEEDDVHNKAALTPTAFNLIIYGLPNLIVT